MVSMEQRKTGTGTHSAVKTWSAIEEPSHTAAHCYWREERGVEVNSSVEVESRSGQARSLSDQISRDKALLDAMLY